MNSKKDKTDMELIHHYGLLEKILRAQGALKIEPAIRIPVDFEVARRVDGTLLFGARVKEKNSNIFDAYQGNRKVFIEGVTSEGKKVKCDNLSLKNMDGEILSGYVGLCEIGKKEFSKNTQVNFSLINFLYHGNISKVEKTQKGKKLTKPYFDLNFDDFKCRIEQVAHYGTAKKILKRQGGIVQTSTLEIRDVQENQFDEILGKVKKLNLLLSVARSTFIDWNHYKINTDGKLVYELYANKIKRDYHGIPLLRDVHPKETAKFLDKAWVEYDKLKKEFDLERLIYGYIDSFEEVFIESRCLLKAVLVDFLASKLAEQEKKLNLLDSKSFESELHGIKKDFEEILTEHFPRIKSYYIKTMVSKLDGLNNRPLKMKLDRLIRKFSIPIDYHEKQRFIKIRNSLAHSSLFPEDEKSVDAFLFMVHFLDRILLRVLGYTGNYNDMENLKIRSLSN